MPKDIFIKKGTLFYVSMEWKHNIFLAIPAVRRYSIMKKFQEEKTK